MGSAHDRAARRRKTGLGRSRLRGRAQETLNVDSFASWRALALSEYLVLPRCAFLCSAFRHRRLSRRIKWSARRGRLARLAPPCALSPQQLEVHLANSPRSRVRRNNAFRWLSHLFGRHAPYQDVRARYARRCVHALTVLQIHHYPRRICGGKDGILPPRGVAGRV